VSAQPLAGEAVGLIEKEIYTIVIVGAASSRDHAIMAIERLFIAAGSRSHEKLMLS